MQKDNLNTENVKSQKLLVARIRYDWLCKLVIFCLCMREQVSVKPDYSPKNNL